MTHRSNENAAVIAVVASAMAWGVLWIPLRATSEAGVSEVWAIVLFYALSVCLLAPLYHRRRRQIVKGGWKLQLAGLLSGTSMVLYSGALLFTSVVNAMLLYYLTPIWSTLLARAFLGEAITLQRWVTIALGLGGLLVVLRIESSLPWPDNLGDWMGVFAGLMWALASVQINSDERNQVPEFTLVYFIWGTLAALTLTLLPLSVDQTAPSLDVVIAVLPMAIPVTIILVVPPAVAIFWGAKILSPGFLGIIFMTEISVGAVTAALWANEPFGTREVLGVVLITTAGLWEPLYRVLSHRTGIGILRKE
ncbi:DMT family transporter [Pelagibius sp. Alg239-R121]|uniref:DMT family transporter n=1 Tax=Pelagibius sp. Alg239-R121 TaxID=2993448 RepID=UPI0024A678EB|nr:DMT family transporter [Pelagibius sp. Alg239-R121]